MHSVHYSVNIRDYTPSAPTVAVHSTMRAWLFAIALDLLPTTFIARASHSAPLLQVSRRLR